MDRGATIGRLRRFLLVMISRATTMASTAGNARSAAMASHAGISAEIGQGCTSKQPQPRKQGEWETTDGGRVKTP